MLRIASSFAFASFAAVSAAQAAEFTPGFDEYSFPGTQFTVDADANDFYATNFGITIDNAYLYKDSRDTFDGIGISVGEVSEIGTQQTGRITFLDTTDFVTVDIFTIRAGVYSAYDAFDNLIQEISAGPSLNFTDTLSGGIISYLEFSGAGGYVQVSGLTYNYDGVTDGRNDDIGGIGGEVPLPASGFLLLGALGLLAARRNR